MPTLASQEIDRFKIELGIAVLGLPPGYRKVLWQRDEEDTEWGVIGSPENAFSLSTNRGSLSLWHPDWAAPLGIWIIQQGFARGVAQAVLDGLTALAVDEFDLPQCFLGPWTTRPISEGP